jgi:hypothetical protein
MRRLSTGKAASTWAGLVDVGAEQQPADHPHRVAHHLLVKVDRPARHRRGIPGVEEAGGLLGHREATR